MEGRSPAAPSRGAARAGQATRPPASTIARIMAWSIRVGAPPALLFAFLFAGPARAAEVRGTVRDALSGDPLEGVVLELAETPHQTTSTREGAFALSGIPAGGHRVRATLPGYRRVEVESPAGGEPVHLVLEPLLVRVDEAVTVTAQRDERRAFDVPESVSSLDRDELSRRALRSTPETLAGMTGVFVQKTNHGGGSPFVRGLTGNQVLLMVDGIRLSNSTFRYGPNQYLATVAPHSIERVEVVRGSGSTLYGSDAIGGVVNVLSRGPRFAGGKTDASARALLRGMTDAHGPDRPRGGGGGGGAVGPLRRGRRALVRRPRGRGRPRHGDALRVRRAIGGREGPRPRLRQHPAHPRLPAPAPVGRAPLGPGRAAGLPPLRLRPAGAAARLRALADLLLAPVAPAARGDSLAPAGRSRAASGSAEGRASRSGRGTRWRRWACCWRPAPSRARGGGRSRASRCTTTAWRARPSRPISGRASRRRAGASTRTAPPPRASPRSPCTRSTSGGWA